MRTLKYASKIGRSAQIPFSLSNAWFAEHGLVWIYAAEYFALESYLSNAVRCATTRHWAYFHNDYLRVVWHSKNAKIEAVWEKNRQLVMYDFVNAFYNQCIKKIQISRHCVRKPANKMEEF